MDKLPAIHPGEILNEEFLTPLGLSAYRLAKAIHVPANRIQMLVNGQRNITADTALRLSRAFDTSPEFWMNLQQAYDLKRTANDISSDLETVPIIAAAE